MNDTSNYKTIKQLFLILKSIVSISDDEAMKIVKNYISYLEFKTTHVHKEYNKNKSQRQENFQLFFYYLKINTTIKSHIKRKIRNQTLLFLKVNYNYSYEKLSEISSVDIKYIIQDLFKTSYELYEIISSKNLKSIETSLSKMTPSSIHYEEIQFLKKEKNKAIQRYFESFQLSKDQLKFIFHNIKNTNIKKNKKEKNYKFFFKSIFNALSLPEYLSKI